ncbi:hypothetical protein D3C84_894440 [compost metagenome]
MLGELQIQQRGEFVAAHARQNVEGSQASLQLFGHPAQHAVTGIVTKGIVDPFKTVEVEVQQHPGAVVTLTAQQQVFHGLIETTAIEQAGQRVGHRLEFQLLMQMTHHRHVQHRHHHRVLLGWQWRA